MNPRRRAELASYLLHPMELLFLLGILYRPYCLMQGGLMC
jgi:hypothetical protein